jgi:hypothetical protein
MAFLRRKLAVVVLGVYAMFEAWVAVLQQGWLRPLFAFFAAALIVAMVGVERRLLWARWLAMGAALVGLLDVFVAIFVGAARGSSSTFVALPLLVLVALGGGRMARHFIEPLPAGSVWRKLAVDRRLRILAAGIVLAVAAVAALLLRAAMGFGDPTVSLGIALLLGSGAALAAAERTAGILLLFAGGWGCAFVAVEVAERAWQPVFCGHAWASYLASIQGAPALVAGAAGALLAFGAFAAPMARFLARRA